MSAPVKPHLYGKHSDTGDLSIRAAATFKEEGGVIDPTMCCLRVEVWSSRAFGPEQRRDHCTEQYFAMPVTEHTYAKGYAEIIGAYEDYWKAWGVDVPNDWKYGVAVACGEAIGKFMGSELVKNSLTLH